MPMDRKGHNSKALIEATRPYERLKDFPIAVDVSGELREKVTKKWEEVLKP
jgi:4-hydroxy-3-polyprenylbenzoate decarboxylase